MANTRTAIQWTDATWNPVTGCRKVSPGCANCYAKDQAPRVFAGQTVTVDAGCPECEGRGEIRRAGVWELCPMCSGSGAGERPRRFEDVRCHPERLEQPLRWRKPRRVFVNSMSDLFHEDVPDTFIAEVFGVMALAAQHTFQILTKRPERMRDLLDDTWWWARVEGSAHRIHHDRTGEDRSLTMGVHGPLPNVWLGVSCEDQRRADERVGLLLATLAAVRFVSAEPLLGPVDVRYYLTPTELAAAHWGDPIRSLPALDWVIVGGESGPKARPMDLEWARSLVDQCKAAGVPVFVKQLGRRPVWYLGDETTGYEGIARPLVNPWTGAPLRDSHGGDLEEWPPDLRVREFPVR